MIVLASASPRRRELLQQHGYGVEIVPPEVEETALPHFTAGEITLLNARKKALAVSRKRPESIVLGADTLVALDNHILGKPRDFDDAFQMLKRLSGRAHEVFSGVWITRRATGETRHFVEMSRVHFRKLDPGEIRAYIDRVRPLDKAGAYAAQEDETKVIARIDGSRTNVIGLPMEALATALEGFSAP